MKYVIIQPCDPCDNPSNIVACNSPTIIDPCDNPILRSYSIQSCDLCDNPTLLYNPWDNPTLIDPCDNPTL